jgi:hypothetical protein
MPYYICYLTDQGNKTISSEATTHPSDEAATEWAEALLRENADCTGVELWREARRIYRSKREQM